MELSQIGVRLLLGGDVGVGLTVGWGWEGFYRRNYANVIRRGMGRTGLREVYRLGRGGLLLR